MRNAHGRASFKVLWLEKVSNVNVAFSPKDLLTSVVTLIVYIAFYSFSGVSHLSKLLLLFLLSITKVRNIFELSK